MKMLRFAVLAAFACAAFADPASAQTTYTWNNTGTSITSAGSWSPTGAPAAGSVPELDRLEFNVLGTFGTSQQFNPDLTGVGTLPAGGTSLSTTANFTGWTFTGNSVLAQPSITAYGPVTHTLNGPSLMGIPVGFFGVNNPNQPLPLSIRVANGSTLVLTGASTVSANPSNSIVMLHGGTLTLDNSTTNTANRLSPDTPLFFQSGTLHLKGNAAGTAFNVGALTSSSTGGVNTFRLTPGGGPLSVNINNSAAGFSTRLSSFSVFRVEATSGVLGGPGANDPKLTFTGTPFVGANGLLANTAGGSTVGYFIVNDANGTDFATWNATDGVKAAGATLTSTTAAGIVGAGTANDRVFFTPGTGTQTASGVIMNGSLRITPTATGGTLDMGTNNLQTVALMLDGDKDFTISGTGGATLAPGTTARYIHVNNPNTTLTTSLVIANSNGPTNIVGPGFVVLNGSNQNAANSGTRINLLGGTLRASAAQLGFTGPGTGTVGSVTFGGGVLEIQGGGAFTRGIGTDPGTVRWEGGNGGFSAFGLNATVNIGGVSGQLTWANAGFVGDGFALKFGSTQSNATLTWQNPIALDNGTGNYFLREINVTRGAGIAADKTVMTGNISGSATTDLLKTGTGVLELASTNDYQGNTLIHGGTLIVANGASLGVSGSFTGNVVVGKGATLAGAGAISPDVGKSVFVNPGGIIRGGNPTVAVDRLGTLTLNSDLVISSTATDPGVLQVEVSRASANNANNSKIAITGTQFLHLNSGSGTALLIDLVPGASALQVGESYTITLATVEMAGHIHLNGGSVQNVIFDPSIYSLKSSSLAFSNVSLAVDEAGTSLNLSFTVAPVPEPTTVLGIAALVGLGAGLRRRLK